jgi:flagellar hook-length control protein FliK
MKTELDSNRLQTTDYQKRWSRWNDSIHATAQSFVDELLKMPVMEVISSEPVVQAKAEKSEDKSERDEDKVDDKYDKNEEKPSDSLCALPVPQQFLVKEDTAATNQDSDSIANEDTLTEKPVQAVVSDSGRNPGAEMQESSSKAAAPVAEQATTETIETEAPLIEQATEDTSTVDAERRNQTLEDLFPNPKVQDKGDTRKARTSKEVKSEAVSDTAVSNNAISAATKANQEIAAKVGSHRHEDEGKEKEIKPTDDEPKLNRRSERLASRARNEDRSDSSDNSASRSESNRDTPAVADKTAATVERIAPAEPSAANTSATTPAVPTATTSTATPVPGAAAPSNVSEVARATTATANTADRGASLAGISSTNTTSSSTSGSRAESTRGSVPTSLSRYQETKLVQRVLRGIEQLSNGGGQVRLRLHPQELGTLQMTLRIEGSQMSAKLEVENSTAKEALLQNLQGLKDRLADQGMQVERFEVTVSSQSNSFGADAGLANGNQDRRSWEQQATSRYATQNNNTISGERKTTPAEPSRTWSRTNGSLDVTV